MKHRWLAIVAIGGDMLRIGQTETALPADEARDRAIFAEQRALVLPQAFAPQLLLRLRMLSQVGRFVSNDVEALGHREIESPPLAGKAIELLLSRPAMFRWLERITACGPISRVDGAIARTHASPQDRLDWHDDLNHPEAASRRLAITIALDDLNYEGGLFELRRVGGTDSLFTFKHEKAGTAVIFEVSERLEHRVLPMTGGGPRVVYAGWFIG